MSNIVDPRKDVFVFNQADVDIYTVEAMVEGLKLGSIFPDILIEKRFGKLGVFDGNHRFRAHLIFGKKLSFREVSSDNSPSYKYKKSDILLLPGVSKFRESKLVDALSYLPSGVANRFCKERDLDTDYYLAQ